MARIRRSHLSAATQLDDEPHSAGVEIDDEPADPGVFTPMATRGADRRTDTFAPPSPPSPSSRAAGGQGGKRRCQSEGGVRMGAGLRCRSRRVMFPSPRLVSGAYVAHRFCA